MQYVFVGTHMECLNNGRSLHAGDEVAAPDVTSADDRLIKQGLLVLKPETAPQAATAAAADRQIPAVSPVDPATEKGAS